MSETETHRRRSGTNTRSRSGPIFVGDFDDDDFDVVIVGSGFGGSVSAYELASRGARVCVLERGKAFPPGSFGRTPSELARNLWDPSEGLHGMFNVWSFKGIDALTASGLGGGSLIYANVMLRKDPSWFVQRHPYRKDETESWPIGYADLEPHYQAVETFLDVQTVPEAADVPKLAALEGAAQEMGMRDEFHRAPLAVRFRGPGGSFIPGEPLAADDYPSIFGDGGRARRTCRLCGECDVGCNDGAKNTLDHTYLSAAAHRGAVISIRSEVTALRRRDGRFEVEFVVHDPEREGRKTDTGALPPRVLTASRVVLAAGAIGSTYLLLRNRTSLGIANPALGTRFCGNGDLLGFILKSERDGEPFPLEGSKGPVISSYIRWPDGVDTNSPDDFGIYLEDAGFPAFMQWLVEATQVRATVTRAAKFTVARIKERFTGQRKSLLSGELSQLLGEGVLSRSSLPLLAMGRDVPDGRLYLDGDESKWLDCTWTTKTSKAYFDHVQAQMKKVSDALRGRMEVNPHYLLNRVITVHSLGGSPMSDEPDQGVVDRFGQVHGVAGLYVADGAVMPGPVGPNPSLTIAAFARWMCEQMPVEQAVAR
ncbi:MAG: FAD-dependent oxidoreductase [Ilumatobacteraceae bacterium]